MLQEVHHTFFHDFIEFGSTVLHAMFVLTPVHLDEVKSNMEEFGESGLPGCVGSSDCMHVVMGGCEYFLKNNHLGRKSSHTICTNNLACNHRCCILHTTSGGPGCWNDQMMVCLDQIIMGIYDWKFLCNK